MQMTKPGDAGHSFLTPDQGDWQGDKNLADGSFWSDPMAAATSALKRIPTYGNWSGPDNKYDAQIKAKYAADPSYDPAKDPAFGKNSAVDGLDAAARDHDLAYYHDNSTRGVEKASMFSMDGLENTRNADRALADAAGREMANPSMGKDGKPIDYSADTRLYADGMQGFFGGRADGVDLRRDYMSGKKDELDVASAAVSDVGKAYDKNGLMGAATEGIALASVAGASAYDWLTS
jgi:hypothetical protein